MSTRPAPSLPRADRLLPRRRALERVLGEDPEDCAELAEPDGPDGPEAPDPAEPGAPAATGASPHVSQYPSWIVPSQPG
jgi:hypothetical protein